MSILTLQFGDYAHYVGSHFWNLQDELLGPAYADASGGREGRPEALYRASEASATPNLLLFDASGSEGLHRAARGAVGLSAVHEALRQAGVAGGEEGAAAAALLLRPHPFLARLDACQEAWDEEEGGEEGEGAGREEEGEGGGGVDEGELESWAEWERAGSGGGAFGGGGGGGGGGAQQPLDAVVQSWGDFCKASLNPRGLVGVGGRSAVGDGVCLGGAGLRSGLAAFDAFSDGSGLADEACLDKLRWALEACDTLEGVQAVVDIDSGWGGFGLDVLNALRDECPKSPMLVLGVSPPRPRYAPAPASALPTGGTHRGVLGGEGARGGGGGGGGGSDDGPSLYASRNRSQLRAINHALAYAAFGAGDLDCTLVPLSLQAAMEAGAGSLPGLVKPSLARPFQSSALLAIGWDSVTLPFRRAALEGGRDFTCPATGWRGSASAPPVDARMASSWGGGGGGGGGRGSAPAPTEGFHPLVALPHSLHMREYLTLLRAGRGHTLRVCAASLALPFPHPCITPSHLRGLLGSLAPPSHCSAALFTPLSHSFQRLPAAAAAAAAPPSPAAAPFAHTLVARGVGSALGPSHPPAAFSCVLDEWLARDGSREAGHALLRTPLPLPITLPRLLPRYRYSSLGGLSHSSLARLGCTRDASAQARPSQHAPHAAALARLGSQARFPPPRGWASLPPGVAAALGAPGGSVLHAGAAGAGAAAPFSAPLLAHLATHPSLGRALGALLEGLASRDSAVGARFGAEASGAGGGAHTASGEGGVSFSQAEDALGGLVDEYTVGGGM